MCAKMSRGHKNREQRAIVSYSPKDKEKVIRGRGQTFQTKGTEQG
jgi:hypothetical protein